MTKAELIAKVAKEAEITKAQAGKVIDCVIDTITNPLREVISLRAIPNPLGRNTHQP